MYFSLQDIRNIHLMVTTLMCPPWHVKHSTFYKRMYQMISIPRLVLQGSPWITRTPWTPWNQGWMHIDCIYFWHDENVLHWKLEFLMVWILLDTFFSHVFAAFPTHVAVLNLKHGSHVCTGWSGSTWPSRTWWREGNNACWKNHTKMIWQQ